MDNRVDNVINGLVTSRVNIKSDLLTSEYFILNQITHKEMSSVLFVYFSLFKFSMKKNGELVFMCSLDMMNKSFGIKKTELMSLLKLMVKLKLISFPFVSRWDRVDNNSLLVILSECDPTNKDYYISVDLNLYFDLVSKSKGEYALVYLTMLKFTNNAEGKCWLTNKQFVDLLKMSYSTIGRIIRWLNEHDYISSYYKNVGDKETKISMTKMEHYVLRNNNKIEKEKFIKIHEKNKIKNLEKWKSK